VALRARDGDHESEDVGGPPTCRIEIGELAALIAGEQVERVILAHQDLDEGTVSHVASSCRSLGVKLSVAPPLRAMLGTAVQLNHLAELPLIEFRTWHPSRSTLASKRLFDLIAASVALVATLPFLLLIAAAIMADSRGPVLYRQRRSGRDGDPFTMLKFRTMVCGADRLVDDVVQVDTLVDPMFKLRDDPRVTRVGRWLRRSSLDELPQLLNVLSGGMSLVGPRPEEVWLTDRYDEPHHFRLQMRPGVTGPMQVHGRGDLSFAERMAIEREYVENYQFGKDLKILLRTFAAVVRGRGAY
jgi:exopolysaccharide biosynthesis polyprenyl glycosylphosphotransferase